MSEQAKMYKMEVVQKSLIDCCNVKEGYTTKGGIERDGILLAIKDERKHLVQNEVRDWLKQNGF